MSFKDVCAKKSAYEKVSNFICFYKFSLFRLNLHWQFYLLLNISQVVLNLFLAYGLPKMLSFIIFFLLAKEKMKRAIFL
jgi:hypothetical protein